MAMLSSKSDQEIGWMLDDYGIKHGPVVETTRTLYEKKLREAMAKERKVKRPSERTFYREEEKDPYVHYRRPLRQEGYGGDWRTNPGLKSEYEELDTVDEPTVFRTQTSYRNLTRPPMHRYETQREPTPEKSPGRVIPLWLQILLFLIVVCTLVFFFMNMEASENRPFGRLT
uniref:Si:ch211-150o23.2 n=1 Tax=Astyanax mexicanus TaxID=7994 RepID=A0A3B1K8M7_ASTMX